MNKIEERDASIIKWIKRKRRSQFYWIKWKVERARITYEKAYRLHMRWETQHNYYMYLSTLYDYRQWLKRLNNFKF